MIGGEAEVAILSLNYPTKFLATLVALHFTPVSESVGRVSTSVASMLASLFFETFLCRRQYRKTAQENDDKIVEDKADNNDCAGVLE